MEQQQANTVHNNGQSAHEIPDFGSGISLTKLNDN